STRRPRSRSTAWTTARRPPTASPPSGSPCRPAQARRRCRSTCPASRRARTTTSRWRRPTRAAPRPAATSRCTPWCCRRRAASPPPAASPTPEVAAGGPASIDDGGLDTTYYVEYGPTGALGSRSAAQLITATGGAASRDFALGGLTLDTQYFARVVAVNALG